MVIRGMATEVCCPRCPASGSGLWVPRYLTSVDRANECGPGIFLSLQGQERIALPRTDLVRLSGLPGVGMPRNRGQSFSVSSSVGCGIGDREVLCGVSSASTYGLGS